MKEVTENGVTFNQSEPGEWVVVHDGTTLIVFELPEGKVETQKTMYTGTESQCLDYIATYNLEFPEELQQ